MKLSQETLALMKADRELALKNLPCTKCGKKETAIVVSGKQYCYECGKVEMWK